MALPLENEQSDETAWSNRVKTLYRLRAEHSEEYAIDTFIGAFPQQKAVLNRLRFERGAQYAFDRLVEAIQPGALEAPTETIAPSIVAEQPSIVPTEVVAERPGVPEVFPPEEAREIPAVRGAFPEPPAIVPFPLTSPGTRERFEVARERELAAQPEPPTPLEAFVGETQDEVITRIKNAGRLDELVRSSPAARERYETWLRRQLKAKFYPESDIEQIIQTGREADLPVVATATDIPEWMPPYEVKDTLSGMKEFFRGIRYLPKQLAASVVTGTQGWLGASVTDKGVGDRIVESAAADINKAAANAARRYKNKAIFPKIGPFPRIKITDVAQLPQNLAFSITALGTGLAVGAGTAAATAALTGPAAPISAPTAGKIAGGAAIAAVAHNMASYQVMQSYLEMKDAEQRETTGAGLTKAQEKKLKREFGFEATKAGLWEALPEAASGLIGFEVVMGKLTGIIGKTAATRVLLGAGTTLAKGAAVLTTEMLTEAVTEMGQAGIAARAGLPGAKDVDWTNPDDWMAAFRAVAPQTFMLTALMAGVGGGIELKRAITPKDVMQSLDAEIGEADPFHEPVTEKIKDISKGEAELVSQLADHARGDAPAGGVREEVTPAPEPAAEPAVAPEVPVPAPEPRGEEVETTLTPEVEEQTVRPAPKPPKAAPKPKTKSIAILPEKTNVLAEIDTAIAEAPEEPVTDTDGVPTNVAFKIDGGVTIVNTQKALTQFRKLVQATPEKMKVTLQQGVTKPHPVAANKEMLGELLQDAPEGMFSDGTLVIKGKPPKGKKFSHTQVPEGILEQILSQSTEPAELLYYSYEGPDLVTQTDEYRAWVEGGRVSEDVPEQWRSEPGDQAVSAIPIGLTEDKNVPLVVFKSGENYFSFNQFKYNMIRKRFKDATYGIALGQEGNVTLIAYEDGEPVAALAATKEKEAETAVRSDPPLGDVAREAGLLAPPATEVAPITPSEEVAPPPMPPEVQPPVEPITVLPPEKPTESSSGYVAKPAEEHQADVAKDIREAETPEIPSDEAGFVTIPTLDDFKDVSDRFRANMQKLVTSQRDVVTDAYGAIEKWRAETTKAGLYADWAKDTLRKYPVSKDDAQFVTRWLDNPDKYETEYEQLSDEAKELATALMADYEQMRELATDVGVLKGWRENYSPHVWRDKESRLRSVLYPAGGRLGKGFRFAKRRTIDTIDEGEALGLHPILDPALLNSVYKYQLYRTIANRNLMMTLQEMKREDGLPVIMGRPKNKEKLAVWEKEYEYVNIPAFGKYMYSGEAGGMPMLIKMPAKADPEIATALNNAFDPWATKGAIHNAYRVVRGRVKRLIMMNPLIHGWNILSDVFDEVHFNPYTTGKVFVRGHKLYKQKDALVEYAAESGLEMQLSQSVSVDLRKELMESSEALRGIWEPIGRLEQWSDRVLWGGIVRNAQLGLFEDLVARLEKRHPDWDKQKVGTTASTYINTLLGTLPHTWMSRPLREAGSIMLFARNWSFSNIDMVVKAATFGRKGLGVKALTPDQKTEIGVMYQKHLIKGMFALIATANMMQLARILIMNKMKDDDLLDGEKEPLRTTFQNEKGHWVDVDTGLKTKTGQKIYIVPFTFRYMRDYLGYAADAKNLEARTLYNKLEPVLKQTIEQIANYSVWQKQEIAKSGAPTYDRLKQRAIYFFEGMSPSVFFAKRPGKVKTPFEWFIPYTGTWIRRGAPGGRFTQLIFEFRREQGYKDSKLDKEIDEAFQRGGFSEATNLVMKRYMPDPSRFAASPEGATTQLKQNWANRVMRVVAPLNFYYQDMTIKERRKFHELLRKHNYDQDELKEAMSAERRTIELRGD